MEGRFRTRQSLVPRSPLRSVDAVDSHFDDHFLLRDQTEGRPQDWKEHCTRTYLDWGLCHVRVLSNLTVAGARRAHTKHSVTSHSYIEPFQCDIVPRSPEHAERITKAMADSEDVKAYAGI